MRFSGLRRATTLAILAVVGVVLWADPASAHAQLLESSPPSGAHLGASPREVTLRFGEQMTNDLDGIAIYDPAGKAVSTGSLFHPGGNLYVIAVRIHRSLPPGGYLVAWHAISADSHPVAGTVSFIVGTGGGAVVSASHVGTTGARSSSPSLVIARALAFIGLSLFVGISTFALWIWGPARAMPRARRCLWAGWGCALGFTGLGMLIEGTLAAGKGIGSIVDPGLAQLTLATSYGHAYLAEFMLLGTAAPLVGEALTRPTRSMRLILAAIFAGLALCLGLEGHPGQGTDTAVYLALNAIHVLAAAIWLGGLASLVSIAVSTADRKQLVPAAREFSKVGLVCVIAIVASGAAATWREVGLSQRALLTTTYGRVVTSKVVVLIAVVALAAVARSVTRGAWHRGDGSGRESGGAASAHPSRLRSSVTGETVGIIGIFVLSATLIALQPAREVVAIPVVGSVQAGPVVTAQISIGSARVGTTTLGVRTLDRSGRPVAVWGVEAMLQAPERVIPPTKLTLRKTGRGSYLVNSVDLTTPGTWKVQVVVSKDLFSDAVSKQESFPVAP